jgi:hypothetical protein
MYVPFLKTKTNKYKQNQLSFLVRRPRVENNNSKQREDMEVKEEE